MDNIYLDISATTPINKHVLELIQNVEWNAFGNPSSIHKYGQKSRAIIERSRLQITKALNCDSSEIIFTGGGTESNNIAIQGLLNHGDHVITSDYEHPAVTNVISKLTKENITVTFIKPESNGSINPNKIKNAIKKNTRMVSIMAVNNELGTINPIKKIGEICKQNNVIFHSDAVQMFGKMPMNINEYHIDLLSISAHKFYGPKGVGALYIKNGTNLKPTILGGGQEKNLRPGTENVSGIAGLGLAAELISSNLKDKISQVKYLESVFIDILNNENIDYSINGEYRIPGVFSITFHGINAQSLVINLDMEGIAISAGSACSSGTIKPSSILLNIGLSEKSANETVRISFSYIHNEEQIVFATKTITRIIHRLKKIND